MMSDKKLCAEKVRLRDLLQALADHDEWFDYYLFSSPRTLDIYRIISSSIDEKVARQYWACLYQDIGDEFAKAFDAL